VDRAIILLDQKRFRVELFAKNLSSSPLHWLIGCCYGAEGPTNLQCDWRYWGKGWHCYRRTLKSAVGRFRPFGRPSYDAPTHGASQVIIRHSTGRHAFAIRHDNLRHYGDKGIACEDAAGYDHANRRMASCKIDSTVGSCSTRDMPIYAALSGARPHRSNVVDAE
jgi:hypothetical protein